MNDIEEWLSYMVRAFPKFDADLARKIAPSATFLMMGPIYCTSDEKLYMVTKKVWPYKLSKEYVRNAALPDYFSRQLNGKKFGLYYVNNYIIRYVEID